MNLRRAKIVLHFCLIAATSTWCVNGVAREPDQQAATAVNADENAQRQPSNDGDGTEDATAVGDKQPADYDNSLGVAFVKNLVADQKAIWTSPAHLHWADGSWLFPLAAVTAGLFATDRAVPPALSKNPTKLNQYVKISDYGVYSLIGAGGGLYLWSKISGNDHQRETGVLAGEAAIDGYAVDTAFKYAFGRQRPYQDQGHGDFFNRGVSFPSDHSAVAWSIASVIAHEYPGPFSKFLVYGLATAVSASRVAGKQHFPSDVFVGGAVGWLIGWQVYRSHHDPELPGGGWNSLSGNENGEEHRDRQDMGSTFVPLDSWVYSAFERLTALGYIHTQIMGLKPWTRIECARLAEEASEALQDPHSLSGEAALLQRDLLQEFAYETNLLSGGHNLTANLESAYVRAVSISGPALTDSYHFGQTVAYDFGRPYERGTNGQAGGSFSAAAGPVALYIRAEYQHAPTAPALAPAAVNAISTADIVSPQQVQAGPFPAINRPQLMDAYAAVNMHNWQLNIGRQSLSWTPGPQGSILWSNNAEPVDMVRLVNPEPFRLPGLLRSMGPVRIDQFFGRLGGHPYTSKPFIYGQKINLKPLSFLELGFGRTVTIGGAGADPVTSGNLARSFFGIADPRVGSVPGDNHSEMDWVIYIPKIRNYVVLYGDAYADDDILPIENPARNPWHPGIYITRFPKLSKLDLHVEGVSTEQAGLAGLATYSGGPANKGQYNYWNFTYRDGYTNGGDLLGNSVGRDGRSIQGWLTYWFSPRNTLELVYRHNSVAQEFIPGGGAWQDYAVQDEVHFGGGFYIKTEMQYEHISHYPVLFTGPQTNFTAIMEAGFLPREGHKK